VNRVDRLIFDSDYPLAFGDTPASIRWMELTAGPVREDRDCRPDLDLPDLKWELINDEREIVRGLSVVKAPGHAAGHQTAIVESKELGAMILENAAIFSQENLQGVRYTVMWPTGVPRVRRYPAIL